MKRLLTAIFAIAMIGLASCAGKYTGGGWTDSAMGAPDKAHVAFNFHADDTDGDGLADSYKGQFEYHDAAAGVALHGVIVECYDLGDGTGYLAGFYTAQPESAGPGGFFDSFVYDFGKPGDADPDDAFDIYVYDGVYGGYYNFGFLQGGNIKFHAPK